MGCKVATETDEDYTANAPFTKIKPVNKIKFLIFSIRWNIFCMQFGGVLLIFYPTVELNLGHLKIKKSDTIQQ